MRIEKIWVTKEGHLKQMIEMNDDHITNTIRMIERNSALYSAMGQRQKKKGRAREKWVMGEMLGFHPIEDYPVFLGLIEEAIIRKLDIVEDRRLVWKPHLPHLF